MTLISPVAIKDLLFTRLPTHLHLNQIYCISDRKTDNLRIFFSEMLKFLGPEDTNTFYIQIQIKDKLCSK